jgi:hypothetical protein
MSQRERATRAGTGEKLKSTSLVCVNMSARVMSLCPHFPFFGSECVRAIMAASPVLTTLQLNRAFFFRRPW